MNLKCGCSPPKRRTDKWTYCNVAQQLRAKYQETNDNKDRQAYDNHFKSNSNYSRFDNNDNR